MLLTRHMLFVGYSLSDDNFQRLVHQVRTAIGSVDRPADSEFGTAITPRSSSLRDDLWEGSIRFLTTEDENGAEDPWRTAVLLDRIGALAAAPAAFIVDDTYSALFTEAQAELRMRLLALWDLVDTGALDAATTSAVTDGLERIGRPADHSWLPVVRRRAPRWPDASSARSLLPAEVRRRS